MYADDVDEVDPERAFIDALRERPYPIIQEMVEHKMIDVLGCDHKA